MTNFDWGVVLNNAMGILVAGAAGLGIFYIATNYFGLLAYPGITKRNVDSVAKEIDGRYKIVTRAIEGGTYRGIYDMGGSLYYYRYTPGKDYVIYPLIYEKFTTEPALFNNVKMIYPV